MASKDREFDGISVSWDENDYKDITDRFSSTVTSLEIDSLEIDDIITLLQQNRLRRYRQDCQISQLNNEDAVELSKWSKLIKDIE